MLFYPHSAGEAPQTPKTLSDLSKFTELGSDPTCVLNFVLLFLTVIPVPRSLLAEPFLPATAPPSDFPASADLDTARGVPAALPVSLVKYHVLHTLQLQVHLHSHMHQAARGGNDSGRGVQARSPRAISRALLLLPRRWPSGKGPQSITPNANSHVRVFMQG